ncbi:MAG: hypothetical protein HC767_06345 [Akkermansiaceae bacterium]|nr:hypothetical protein [Akkermansiaceae bacterium]
MTFGLARPADRKFEEGEGIFGTPHYTAPEVVDHPHSVDYRADIFSVGVMLHELLTSRLPADDPRPASAIINCDPRFDQVIHRATHPDPNGRYVSANDLAKDLQAIGASLGQMKAAPAAAIPRPHLAASPIKHKKSSSSFFTTFLFAVVTLGLLAGGLYWYSSQPPKSKVKKDPTIVIIPAPPKNETQDTTNQEKAPEAIPDESTASSEKEEEKSNNEASDDQMAEDTEQTKEEVVETPETPFLPGPPGRVAQAHRRRDDSHRARPRPSGGEARGPE